MALVPCPECGKEISSAANVCPSCSFRIRKAKRGFFGFMFKSLFILFNLLMLAWALSYCAEIGELSTDLSSDAELAGAAVGGMIGSGFLMMIWALGAIILGALAYFTKGKD